MKEKRPEEEKRYRILKAAGILTVPVAVFSGLTIGLYLDKAIGIPPVFTLLFITAAIIAGYLGTLKIRTKKGDLK